MNSCTAAFIDSCSTCISQLANGCAWCSATQKCFPYDHPDMCVGNRELMSCADDSSGLSWTLLLVALIPALSFIFICCILGILCCLKGRRARRRREERRLRNGYSLDEEALLGEQQEQEILFDATALSDYEQQSEEGYVTQEPVFQPEKELVNTPYVNNPPDFT